MGTLESHGVSVILCTSKDKLKLVDGSTDVPWSSSLPTTLGTHWKPMCSLTTHCLLTATNSANLISWIRCPFQIKRNGCQLVEGRARNRVSLEYLLFAPPSVSKQQVL